MNYTHNDYMKSEQENRRRMIKLGADRLISVGDLASIYTDPNRASVYKPNAGFKRCKTPYEQMFASYSGKVVGKAGKVMSTRVNNAGYEVLGAVKAGKHTTTTVHRLTASAWVPNNDPTNKRTVDHKDSNKLNNVASNLQWLTYTENLTKAHRMAQMAGEGNRTQGMPVVKIDDDGTRTEYTSASAAGKANGLSAVSVTGNAKRQLHLDRPYHFELAKNESEHQNED